MKSDDSANVRACLAQATDDGFVLQYGVTPFHCRQDAVRTGLYRQVQMRNQLGQARIGIDQARGEFAWVAGGITDAFDTGDIVDIFEQQGEISQSPSLIAPDRRSHSAPAG